MRSPGAGGVLLSAVVVSATRTTPKPAATGMREVPVQLTWGSRARPTGKGDTCSRGMVWAFVPCGELIRDLGYSLATESGLAGRGVATRMHIVKGRSGQQLVGAAARFVADLSARLRALT